MKGLFVDLCYFAGQFAAVSLICWMLTDMVMTFTKGEACKMEKPIEYIFIPYAYGCFLDGKL